MQKVLKGDRTKTKLAATLKVLLNKKPLEKVRIHELTEQCDIHRQTFYYHFSDVYELFTWCVQADTKKLTAFLEQFSTWQETMNGLLMYIGRNRGYFKAILEHASPSVKQEFFETAQTAVAEKLHDSIPAEMTAELPPFYLQSFSLMLRTMLEKWIQDDTYQSPAEIVSLLEKLLASTFPS